MKLSPVDMRDFDRLFYPVIPVIVTAEHGDVVDAMVATWWTIVSYDPPRMALALAPERLTYRLIVESRRFGVSVVSMDYVRSLFFLGDFSGRFLKNKVEKSGLTIVKGGVLGAPLIAEAYASAELELWRVIDVGDHDLVVGEVRAAYGLPSFNGVWRIEDSKPVLYLGRLRARGLKRACVSLEGARTEVVDVEYSEDLERAREARKSLLDEVFSAVESSPDELEARRRVAEIAKRHGLDEVDAELLLKEALRRFKPKT